MSARYNSLGRRTGTVEFCFTHNGFCRNVLRDFLISIPGILDQPAKRLLVRIHFRATKNAKYGVSRRSLPGHHIGFIDYG